MQKLGLQAAQKTARISAAGYFYITRNTITRVSIFPPLFKFPELLNVCPPGVWHEPALHLPPGEVRPSGEEQHDGLHLAHHDPNRRHRQLRLVDVGGGGEDGHHHLGGDFPHHQLAKALRTTKKYFVLRRSTFVISFYCYSNCRYLIPAI